MVSLSKDTAFSGLEEYFPEESRRGTSELARRLEHFSHSLTSQLRVQPTLYTNTSTDPPTGMKEGDAWIITSVVGSMGVYRYDGLVWVQIQTTMSEVIAGSAAAGESISVLEHGLLGSLLVDDHSQYPLMIGRLGGQQIVGGPGGADDLTLYSARHVILQPSVGMVGIGTVPAWSTLEVGGEIASMAPGATYDAGFVVDWIVNQATVYGGYVTIINNSVGGVTSGLSYLVSVAGAGQSGHGVQGHVGGSAAGVFDLYGGHFEANAGGFGQSARYIYGVYGDANAASATSCTIAYGGYFSAVGATANYGLIVAAGDAGFGIITPVRRVEIFDGTNPQLRLTQNAGVDYADFHLDASGFLSILPSNFRVGINIAPLTLLHLYEDNASTNAGITIEQDGAGDSVLQFLLTGVQRMVMGIDNSDGDKFKISDATALGTNDRITILTTGEVGILTNTPSEEFDVYGSVRIGATDADYLTIDKTYSNHGGYGNRLDMIGGICMTRSVDTLVTYLLSVFSTADAILGRIYVNNAANSDSMVIRSDAGYLYTNSGGTNITLSTSTTHRVYVDLYIYELVYHLDETPYYYFWNNTHEDSDFGRESRIYFRGEQSGGELSTLAEIEACHSGAADDEQGRLRFFTNDGNDGNSPTEQMRIEYDGGIFLYNVKAGATQAAAGAAAGETWVTSGHATLPDNVQMLGV